MAAAERNVNVRLAVLDGGKVKAELQSVGTAGAAAMETLSAKIEAVKVDRLTSNLTGAEKALRSLGSASASFATQMTALDRANAALRNMGQSATTGIGAVSQQATKAGETINRLSTHEVTNLAAQFSDLGVQLASGQSPFMAMIQQGPQIGAVLGDRGLKGAIAGVGQGLMSLITPTTLALGGFLVAGYAASSIINALGDDTDDLNTVLEDSRRLADELKESFTGAGKGAESFVAQIRDVATLQAGDNLRKLTEQSKIWRSEFAASFNNMAIGNPMGDFTGVDLPDIDSRFGAFEEPIRRFREEVAAGRGDVERFVTEVAQIGNATPALGKLATEIVKSATAGGDLSHEMEVAQAWVAKLAGTATDAQLALIGLSRSVKDVADANKMLDELSRRTAQVGDERAQFVWGYINRLGTGAVGKLPEVEKEANALYDAQEADKERQKTEREGETARKRALDEQKRQAEQLKDATDNLLNSQQNSIETISAEIAAFGRSTEERAKNLALIEAEQRIREIGLNSQSREADEIRRGAVAEAEKRTELDRLKDAEQSREKAARDAETQRKRAFDDQKRQAEQLKDATDNLLNSQRDSAEMLASEISLVGRSEEERARYLARLEAEQRIREIGIDSRSREADQIRRQADALAEMGLALDRQRDAWNTVRSTGENALDSLGDAIVGKAVDWKNVAQDVLRDFTQIGVINPLKNLFLNTNYGTGSDLGSVLGNLFGKKTDPLKNGGVALGSSVANPMFVTVVDGSLLGAAVKPLGMGGIGSDRVAAGDSMAAALKVSQSYEGLNEKEDTATISGILSASGTAKLNPADQAWCAAYANAVLAKSGLTGTGSNLASSFQSWGQATSNPQLGDIVNLKPQSAGSSGHVGFFAGMQGSNVLVSGGNQSNGVNTSTFAASDVVSFRTATTEIATASTAMADATKSAASAAGDFSSGLGDATKNILGGLGQASTTAAGATAGGGLGGLGSLFGSVLGVVGKIFGFDEGGYTGGKRGRLAGMVHGEEFVFDAAATSNIGPANLEAIHQMAKQGRRITAAPLAALASQRQESASSGQGGRIRDKVEMTLNLAGANGDEAIGRIAYAAAQKALGEYDASLLTNIEEKQYRAA